MRPGALEKWRCGLRLARLAAGSRADAIGEILLAAAGAAGGALLAAWFSAALVTFLSTDYNRLFLDLTLDWRMFTFIVLVAVITCLLFGLSPAIAATSDNPARTMSAGGRSSTDSHERFNLRRGLVVVQIALSTVLIVGAMLSGWTLANLAHVTPVFGRTAWSPSRWISNAREFNPTAGVRPTSSS